MKEETTVTRRDFLRGTAGFLLSSTLGSLLPSEGGAQSRERSSAGRARVILIRNKAVLDPNGKIDPTILQSMVDEALRNLVGQEQTLKAWQALFKANDVVGIKTNNWRHLPTPEELEEVVQRRLVEAGITEKNIAVDDRGVLHNAVFLNSTALINMRPVRTHHWAGVGTCLKNYIMFSPSPSSYHPNGCSDLGRIWTTPVVRGKTRLNILVALTPQFYGRGANFFDRRFVWPYKGLIVGTDPVAVDAVGAELLRKKRIAYFGEDRALDVAPIHIGEAERKYKLGVSDLGRIDIVKMGWMDEALI